MPFSEDFSCGKANTLLGWCYPRCPHCCGVMHRLASPSCGASAPLRERPVKALEPSDLRPAHGHKDASPASRGRKRLVSTPGKNGKPSPHPHVLPALASCLEEEGQQTRNGRAMNACPGKGRGGWAQVNTSTHHMSRTNKRAGLLSLPDGHPCEWPGRQCAAAANTYRRRGGAG